MVLTIDLGADEVYATLATGTIAGSYKYVKAVPVGDDIQVDPAGLGDPVFGVAIEAGTAGDAIRVNRSFPVWAVVIAGAAMTAGDSVMSDADGHAVTWDGNADHSIVGELVADVAASGDPAYVDSSNIGSLSIGKGARPAPTYYAVLQVTNGSTTLSASTAVPLLLSNPPVFGTSFPCVGQASYGYPVTAAVGEAFSFWIYAPGFLSGKLQVGKMIAVVSNADGTEKMSLYSFPGGLRSDIFLASQQQYEADLSTFSVDPESAGTDLTVSGSTIVSAAGGPYFATFYAELQPLELA